MGGCCNNKYLIPASSFVHAMCMCSICMFFASALRARLLSVMVLFSQSIMRSSISSLIASFLHSFAHPLICAFFHSFIRSFVRSFIQSRSRPFIHFFVHPFSHASVRMYPSHVCMSACVYACARVYVLLFSFPLAKDGLHARRCALPTLWANLGSIEILTAERMSAIACITSVSVTSIRVVRPRGWISDASRHVTTTGTASFINRFAEQRNASSSLRTSSCRLVAPRPSHPASDLVGGMLATSWPLLLVCWSQCCWPRSCRQQFRWWHCCWPQFRWWHCWPQCAGTAAGRTAAAAQLLAASAQLLFAVCWHCCWPHCCGRTAAVALLLRFSAPSNAPWRRCSPGAGRPCCRTCPPRACPHG